MRNNILKNFFYKKFLIVFVIGLLFMSIPSEVMATYTWIGSFYSSNAGTTSDPLTMAVMDNETWWLEIQIYEKASAGGGAQIVYKLNDGALQYLNAGFDWVENVGNNDKWNNWGSKLGPHPAGTNIKWYIEAWSTGAPNNLYYHNSATISSFTGNFYEFTVTDDDASAPTLNSTSAPNPLGTENFVITLNLTDASGISETRSRAYYSWTSNPGPSNNFYSTTGVSAGSDNYTFTCPYNIGGNEFSGKGGQTLYWKVIYADADNDAGAGDADSSTAQTTGTAVITS